MVPRLGVNIDHVATLRQVRGEDYPSTVAAASVCLNEGADQITIHLREDRRHIQDTDVEAIHLVTKRFGRPLNLEMGCHFEIVDIACTVAPDWVCLVPENRQERTTEGGLNLICTDTFKKVEEVCHRIKKANPTTKISLFLEADEQILDKAVQIKHVVNAVEIHTGDFARDFLLDNTTQSHIERFKMARDKLQSQGIASHAGHGLTDKSTEALLQEALFEEYNIGHWIVCQALFQGLGQVVKDLRNLFNRYGTH